MAGNAALSNPAHVSLPTARGTVLDLLRQVASLPQTLWVSRRCGRLANRLILAANLIAYAEQHGCRVVNYTLHSYAKHFQRLQHDWKCVYPSQGVPLMDRLPWIANWLRETRLCYRLVSLGSQVLPRMPFLRHRIQTVWEGDGVSPIDLETTDLLAKLREVSHVFIHGWEFRAPRALEKHGDKVRRYFLPHRRHRSASREVIGRLRSQGDLVVGVHVRQGDYRHWRGGKYYYPVTRYAAWMREFQAQFFPRRTAFLVCSDEPRTSEEFPGLAVGFGPGHMVADLDALGRCDYLMGAFSTYTQWASFYGQVPLLHFHTENEVVALDKFQVSDLNSWPID